MKCLARFVCATAGLLLISTPAWAQYGFLRGSKWYVPTETLPAVNMPLNSNVVQPLSDQTVWEITGYSKGYFWGRSVAVFKRPSGAQLGPVACSRMLGSVTPSGRVHITFVPQRDVTTRSAVTGIGTLAREAPQGWTFEMQMATGTASVVAHWSYMYQCKSGDACETTLPGTSQSLDEFLAQCDPD
jgi:hypothetical protein